MTVVEPKVYETVKSFLERQKVDFEESEEQYCCKFTVKSGPHQAHISVFNSGKIVVGGKDSSLKAELNKLKEAIETSTALPGQVLPFEIEKYPETILEKVPDCDPVIIAFVREAIKCYKAEAILATAFMLGAASEKAINLLIDRYAEAIQDENNKNKFKQRISSKLISKKWEEFKSSYSGCKSKSTDAVLNQDLDSLLGSMFHFCRITRNEIGHPQIVPDLDKGVILANLAHFVQYIKRIYDLAAHFQENGVKL